MEDKDEPSISKEFYKYMFRNPGNRADYRDSAEALNMAIREMRKKRWNDGPCSSILVLDLTDVVTVNCSVIDLAKHFLTTTQKKF